MKLRSILFAIATTIVVVCLAPPAWFQAKSMIANWQEEQRARAAAARLARIREWNKRPTALDDAVLDRLFDMPQPRWIGVPWAGAEHWGGVLTLRAGSARHSLRCDALGWMEPWTDDNKRLNAFARELNRMVKASPAYRALPRPRGMYID